jgi:hypothetical protein
MSVTVWDRHAPNPNYRSKFVPNDSSSILEFGFKPDEFGFRFKHTSHYYLHREIPAKMLLKEKIVIPLFI